MSTRRLVATSTAMAAVAAALLALAPSPSAAWRVLAAPQQVVDAQGADALLMPLAGALAWLAWGWGALGLALTAATALPGLLGTAAGLAQRFLVPQAGRRAAALLLGVGMGLGAPVTAFAGAAAPAAPAAASVSRASSELDRPAAPVASHRPIPAATPSARPLAERAEPAAPDWPANAPAEDHVVVPGDCLWRIAAAELAPPTAGKPSDAQVAAAVQAWWHRNAAVIGNDPDLILPGQRLRSPESP